MKPSSESRWADSFPLTDTGLAERFALQHGDEVRYCFAWSKWLCWDGRRWKIDTEGEVERRAKATVRSVLREAAAEPDDNRRKALVDFARASESVARRVAMLTLARSEPPLPITPDKLDGNPWGLNLLNGTLDLRSGKLRAHDAGNLLTKLAPVEYHADAGAPTWLAFLDRIFDGNANLIGFVQRLLGYCLTGRVTEQVLPILWGSGANGKSTLLGVMLELLGEDYAIKAAPELVMVKRDSHPTERADLFGKRLVACIETSEGRRLAETAIKEMTGGDHIRARRMREDFWQFRPTHKIIVACNHKPVVRGTDHAIWRRVRLVPFTVAIPDDEQDRELPDKLRDEAAGILAWLVRGCRDWIEAGDLAAPPEVVAATAAYRGEEDVLAAFIRECCIVEPCARVRAGKLYDAFLAWGGEKGISQRAFGLMLNERGFERAESKGCWRLGIGLAREPGHEDPDSGAQATLGNP